MLNQIISKTISNVCIIMKKDLHISGKKNQTTKHCFKFIVNCIHARYIRITFIKMTSYLKSVSQKFWNLRWKHSLIESLRCQEQENEAAYMCNSHPLHMYILVTIANEYLHSLSSLHRTKGKFTCMSHISIGQRSIIYFKPRKTEVWIT